MFIQCVWEIRRTGHWHNYNFFGANAAKPLKYDFPDWFWCMCELQLRQVMSPQNSYVYVWNICVYIYIVYRYIHVAKPHETTLFEDVDSLYETHEKSWNTKVVWDDLSHLAPCPNGSSRVSIIWRPQTFHEIQKNTWMVSWLASIFCINFGQTFELSSVFGRLSYPKRVALSTMPQMMYSEASGWMCAVNSIRKPAALEETAKEA